MRQTMIFSRITNPDIQWSWIANPAQLNTAQTATAQITTAQLTTTMQS
jgi:hypothetical protein